MSHKPTVAIAGATGGLGQHIIKAFLNPLFRDKFSRITVLTRSADSPKAQELLNAGASIVGLRADPYSYAQDLKGVDILINAVGRRPDGSAASFSHILMTAAAKAGVKVYFPSDFGVDTRPESMKFSQPEWASKVAHEQEARETRMKVVSLFNGLFLEIAFMPALGLNAASKQWTVIGSSSVPFSVTAKRDIGFSVASLAILAYGSPGSVPDYVRVAGDTVSPADAKMLFEAESGEQIEFREENLDAFENKLMNIQSEKERTANFLSFLRLLLGQGSVNFTTNQNELVNPGETLWKWRTVKEYAKEVGGKPFV